MRPNQYRTSQERREIFPREEQTVVKSREISHCLVIIECNLRLVLKASLHVLVTLRWNYDPAHKAMFGRVLSLWFVSEKVAVRSREMYVV